MGGGVYHLAFRHILLPVYTGVIRRDGFTRYLREYESNQTLTRRAIVDLQLDKLNRLLRHAWRTVPHLARRWAEAGLLDRPLSSIEELEQYPLITKEEITANFAAMISTEWRGRTLSKATGGSTGVPFRFEYTRESDARRRAVMWRGYSWSGARMGDRCAYLWGVLPVASRFQRVKLGLYDRAYNRYMLNCFRMSQRNLGEYAARLRHIRPRYVVSYVNPLVTLCRWALENGVSLEGPKAVLTGAEALSTTHRMLIGAAFRVPITNTYGCREVMLIASECARGNLHCNADHLVIETVDARGMDSKESSGRVALTDLHNYAMPLVRYLNGDAAARSDATCPCGLELPLLARIEGRLLDAIRTVDGRLLPGEFFPQLLKEFPWVHEFQVIQRSLESLELKLVPRGEVTSPQLDSLLGGIRDSLGSETRVEVQVVAEIPRTRSGKLRVTVSMLDQSC